MENIRYNSEVNSDEDIDYLKKNYETTKEIINSDNIVKNFKDYDDNKYEFHFQPKIRNSGFWGRVKLRKGTLLVIVGIILICISISVISVFWRWWYGPEINIPCRVVGITLLIVGFLSILFGLISNWMVSNNPSSKHLIGSPPRFYSWILLISIISLITASLLMAIYYTYWHNRWINTPLIVISIILFFFGTIAFSISLVKNIKEMKKLNSENSSSKINKQEEAIKLKGNFQEVNTDSNIKQDFEDENPKKLKKNFRKKMVKITPRKKNNTFLLSNDKTTIF
jgi:hypothetical protein